MRKLLMPLLLVAASLSHAEDLKGVASQHGAGFKKAVMTGDMGWFERVAAPDQVEYEKPGMKSGMAGVKVRTMDNKVEKVQPKGKGMVVTTNCHMAMVMDAPIRDEETWSKDSGVWKIHCLRTLSDRSTRNGTPMKMEART